MLNFNVTFINNILAIFCSFYLKNSIINNLPSAVVVDDVIDVAVNEDGGGKAVDEYVGSRAWDEVGGGEADDEYVDSRAWDEVGGGEADDEYVGLGVEVEGGRKPEDESSAVYTFLRIRHLSR